MPKVSIRDMWTVSTPDVYHKDLMVIIIDSSLVDTKTKGQRSLLSCLLSSADKERRLAALEYLSKDLHQIPNSIQIDLANLLINETDHRCLVVALEMFVEVCGELDTGLMTYSELKILWDRLTSFARKSRGVTVASKALPACSVTLKYIINMSGKETNSSELQLMLSHWGELIEMYCQWEQDEVLRLGTVQSLQCFGVTVMRHVIRCEQESALKHSCFVETAIRYVTRVVVVDLDLCEACWHATLELSK